MPLPFKDRIALQYMLVTAALVAAVFLAVFVVVKNQVYADLDAHLHFEAAKHAKEIFIEGDKIRFLHKDEWMEREHREAQVAPIFIQINDLNGRVMDRSPNLKGDRLLTDTVDGGRRMQNADLRGFAIRVVREPVIYRGEKTGYVFAAISSESAQHVLNSLQMVLLFSFPAVLLVLFGIARILAGRSIEPIAQITATTNRITRAHLAERIQLPQRPDELYTLASAINGLLDRLQHAVEREKQFTADASHELRTPLAVMKGTLEVLIRKPRNSEEYIENIAFSIQEIDRLTYLVDQLLLLARFDNQVEVPGLQELELVAAIHEVLHRHRADLNHRNIFVDIQEMEDARISSDPYLLDLILDNIIANAIKYSPAHSTISIELEKVADSLVCRIRDQGIGIKADDIGRIFDPFYRSNALSHKQIGGTGLGLSIVNKACALLNIGLEVESELERGTAFILGFSLYKS